MKELVDRFLACPLPKGVRPDECVMTPDYPHLTGTHLLTADQADQMLSHTLRESIVLDRDESEEIVDALKYSISKYAPRVTLKHKAKVKALIKKIENACEDIAFNRDPNAERATESKDG